MKFKLNSLRHRFMLAASLILLLFLGFTTWSLDKAYLHSAYLEQRSTLMEGIYAFLAGVDEHDHHVLAFDNVVRDPRFANVDGFIVAMSDASGERLYQNREQFANAWRITQAPGQSSWVEYDDYFVLNYGIVWINAAGKNFHYTITIASLSTSFLAKIAAFRQQVFIWLGLAALLLILLQLALFHWAFRPISALMSGLKAIEQGVSKRLPDVAAEELQGVVDNINALLAQQALRETRYENALGDLAHSLKTPLALLQVALDKKDREDESQQFPQLVQTQIKQLDKQIRYYLQRASNKGRVELLALINVKALIEKLIASLQKVHQVRKIEAIVNIPDDVIFVGGEHDFFELFGNLLDNAFKWAQQKVSIEIAEVDDVKIGKALRAVISDDGPGIATFAKEHVQHRFHRGVDDDVGHGLGLAIVKDIVDLYQGHLLIEDNLPSGAKIVVTLQK